MCQNEHADIEVREKKCKYQGRTQRDKRCKQSIAGISHKKESVAGMV
jgi:hypothetical protein